MFTSHTTLQSTEHGAGAPEIFWDKWMPCGSAGKESACNVGDLGFTPGLGRSPGEGKGYPLQYSCLGNPMDCIVHGWGCKESDRTEQPSFFKLYQY